MPDLENGWLVTLSGHPCAQFIVMSQVTPPDDLRSTGAVLTVRRLGFPDEASFEVSLGLVVQAKDRSGMVRWGGGRGACTTPAAQLLAAGPSCGDSPGGQPQQLPTG